MRTISSWAPSSRLSTPRTAALSARTSASWMCRRSSRRCTVMPAAPARVATLWGTERGPAADWMKAEELSQRVAVIQRYLNHSGYRVVEGPLPVPGQDNQRAFRVELQRRNGCNVVLPIDLVRAKSGTWLVLDVHLDVAGNPAAGCKP